VWVATGDKVTTAINIGYMAGLLDNKTEKIILREDTNLKKELDDNIQKKFEKDHALIIDGGALARILGNDDLKKKLIELQI